jgi:hypothetical protein
LLVWQGDVLLQAFGKVIRFFVDCQCIKSVDAPGGIDEISIIRIPAIGSRILVAANSSTVCFFWIDIEEKVLN